MLKKKIFWIILLVVLALAAGGYVFYRIRLAPAQVEAAGTALQTARVQRGEIIISASGIGTVIPSKEFSVGFSSSGLIDQIYVGVGDLVQQGDVLAQQGNLEQLDLALATAQRSLADAQEALQYLYDNLDLDRADAAKQVSAAQVDLDEAVEARAVMDYSRCASGVIEKYYYAWLEAKAYVEKLESWNWPTGDMISEAAVERNRLFINYDWCTTPFSEQEKGAADAQAAMAQVQLDLAQAAMDSLQEGPDPDTVAQAQAKVAIAEAELKIAEKNINNATLVAPISGTVMSVDAQAGETVNGVFIELADLQTTMLEIFLDEADLAMAGVGYAVEVVFDALPDSVFTGYITHVDPSLTNSGNAKVVRAVVQLDDGSFVKPQIFPVGMNAAVEVIGSQVEDALLVPVEALRKLDVGEYAVMLMQDGQPKLQVVEVGIMDFTYAEILSGLQEGDYVTTGIVETE